MSAPNFRFRIHSVVCFKSQLLASWLLLSGLLLGLSGCHNDHVTVNSKDTTSPQFAYRLDELALLEMLADDIQEMERKKQYGKIYDDYASQDFKSSVSRRMFLIMANCVEKHLGGLQEFNPNERGFRRQSLQKNGKGSVSGGFLDLLNRKVERTKGTIEEQLIFIPYRLNFKLNGLYWISKDKQFLECVAQSTQAEINSAVPSTTEGSDSSTSDRAQPAQPNASEAPDSSIKPSTETDTQQQPTTDRQPSEPPVSAKTDSIPNRSESDTSPAQHTGKPPTPSAQPATPVEKREAPTSPRPAGAGAVTDTTKPEKPVPEPIKPPAANPDNESKPPVP